MEESTDNRSEDRRSHRCCHGPTKRRGLDSTESWITAFLCGGVIFFASLNLAAMGSIFWGLLRDFGAERGRASWPLTAITSCMQMSSPLFSMLVELGAVRHSAILRCCSATAALALILCYFAFDSIVALVGLMALYGTCLAGIFMSANVLMAGHFERQRAAASGLQETLAGLSVLFLPALSASLIKKFYTARAISIIGGISSTGVVFSFFVRPFRAELAGNANGDFVGGEDERPALVINTAAVSSVDVADSANVESLDDGLKKRDVATNDVFFNSVSRDQNESGEFEQPVITSTCLQSSSCLENLMPCDDENKHGVNVTSRLQLDQSRLACHRSTDEGARGSNDNSNCDALRRLSFSPSLSSQTSARMVSKCTTFGLRASELCSLLLTPAYLLDVFSFFVIFEGYSLFIQVSADYSNDLSALGGTNWLVPIFGIGDLIFRLLSGFLADAGYFMPDSLMLIGSIIQAAAFLAFSLATSLESLFSVAFVLGASTGCRIILFIIVLINDFGLPNLSHTFSFANLLIGLAGLLKPFLVGYFRDRLGKYMGLFWYAAIINTVATCYWLIRFVHRYRSHLAADSSYTVQ